MSAQYESPSAKEARAELGCSMCSLARKYRTSSAFHHSRFQLTVRSRCRGQDHLVALFISEVLGGLIGCTVKSHN